MFSKKQTALKFLIFATILFSTTMAKAEPRVLLNEGINAYQQGQWDLAREKFSQLLGDKRWEFVGLYNLGNVATRQKHFGEALGYFRRALALKPQDKDTWFNYRFVLNNTPNQLALGRNLSNYEFIRNEYLNRFSFTQSLIVLFFASLFMLWNLYKYIRNYKFKGEEDKSLGVPPLLLIIWGILFLVSISSSTLKLIDTFTERGTIVVAKVDLRSGPSETNASMSELTEGLEVLVQSDEKDWKQVTHPNGLTGWVPKNSIMTTTGWGPW